jgi:hypothetical protein
MHPGDSVRDPGKEVGKEVGETGYDVSTGSTRESICVVMCALMLFPAPLVQRKSVRWLVLTVGMHAGVAVIAVKDEFTLVVHVFRHLQ